VGFRGDDRPAAREDRLGKVRVVLPDDIDGRGAIECRDAARDDDGETAAAASRHHGDDAGEIVTIEGWSAPTLFTQGLQLRDDLQILWLAGGALDVDEAVEAQAEALDAEGADANGVGEEVFVSAAGDLAQQAQVAQGGRQSEVQAALDGSRIEVKGQTGRRSAQVGSEGSDGRYEATAGLDAGIDRSGRESAGGFSFAGRLAVRVSIAASIVSMA